MAEGAGAGIDQERYGPTCTPAGAPVIRAALFDFGGVITTSPFEAFRRFEQQRGLPDGFIQSINRDNADNNAWARFERGELTAEAFVDWCRRKDIELRCIQPGKPDQNAYIEQFNRSYREEVLSAYVFESIAQVQLLTDEWLTIYNEQRPHDSLGRVPPLTLMPRPNR